MSLVAETDQLARLRVMPHRVEGFEDCFVGRTVVEFVIDKLCQFCSLLSVALSCSEPKVYVVSVVLSVLVVDVSEDGSFRNFTMIE